MSLLDPKMSLRLWIDLQDPYNHDQLADNWAKIGFHDHTPGRGVQIPTEGILDGAITSAKVGASIFAPWRHVISASSFYGTAVAAQTQWMGPSGATVSSGNVSANAAFMYIDPADFAVTSKTTEFRLRITGFTNTVAPVSSFTFQMAPINSVAGSAGALTLTLGAGTGSTVVFTTPGASSRMQSVSTTFSLSANWYAITAINSALTATNSASFWRADLQVHNI